MLGIGYSVFDIHYLFAAITYHESTGADTSFISNGI